MPTYIAMTGSILSRVCSIPAVAVSWPFRLPACSPAGSFSDGVGVMPLLMNYKSTVKAKVLAGTEGGAEGLAAGDQCVRDDSNCLQYSNRFKLATDTQQH